MPRQEQPTDDSPHESRTQNGSGHLDPAANGEIVATGAFSSFQAPAFRVLWLAGLFSFISVQMQFLLRGLLAWEITEREGALGLTYLCFGVTLLIATPLGGVASDRLSKRAVLIFSQAVIAVAAAGMGVAVSTGIVQFWMLLLAAVAQGAAFGFFGPARIAIAAEIVGREHLGNAITLSLLSMNGTRVFAPAVAGVLAGVATIGIGGAYLISATFSTVAFVFLLRLPRSVPAAAASVAPTTTPSPAAASNGSHDAAAGSNGSYDATVGSNGSHDVTVGSNGSHGAAASIGPNGAASGSNGSASSRADGRADGEPKPSPLAEVVAGVRYVGARPPLRRLVLSSFFVIMFGFNYVAFYPALVNGVFGLGNAWVGLISSASAVGAVAVSFPLAARADSPWAKAAMVIGGLGFGIGVMGVGVSPTFWVAFAVICAIGCATTVFQSLSSTLAMSMTDSSHQGRVQSLMQLSFAGFGIAALPLGVLAEVIGLRPTIVLMGAIATGAMLIYLVAEGGRKALRPVAAVESAADGAHASVGHDGDLARTPAAGA